MSLSLLLLSEIVAMGWEGGWEGEGSAPPCVLTIGSLTPLIPGLCRATSCKGLEKNDIAAGEREAPLAGIAQRSEVVTVRLVWDSGLIGLREITWIVDSKASCCRELLPSHLYPPI